MAINLFASAVRAYIYTLQELSQPGGAFDATIAGKISRLFFQASIFSIPPILAYRNPYSLIWAPLTFSVITAQDKINTYLMTKMGFLEAVPEPEKPAPAQEPKSPQPGLPQELSDEEWFEHVLIKYAFSVCLTGPINEEIIFRGLIQPGITRLGQSMCMTPLVSKAISILITSSLFSMSHLLNNANPDRKLQALNAGCLGLIYGVARERFGLSTSILAHIMHNSKVIIKIYFSQNYRKSNQ